MPAPMRTVLILAVQGSSSSVVARALDTQEDIQGVCSLTMFIRFSSSALSEISSAAAPSPAILAPLPTSFNARIPRLPTPNDLAKARLRAPTRSPPPTAPPTPPVAAVSKPNSTKPRASLPRPVLFSGVHSSGTSSQLPSPAM